MARRFYGVEKSRVIVAPNIIDSRFFNLKSDRAKKRRVLCVGNICPRKNQLRLAQACELGKIEVRIVGGSLPGDSGYVAEVKRIADRCPWVQMVGELQYGSDALVEEYAQATCFALPSCGETQPISALEAAAAKCGLILGKCPYASQKYFKNARLVNPFDVEEILRGIQDVLSRPGMYEVRGTEIEDCTESRVGMAYLAAYERALMQ